MKLTIVAGLALICAASAFAQNTPSLKDTLLWMRNTLDSGAGSLYMSQKDGSTEKREWTMPGAQSCDVGFSYQTGILTPNSFGIIKNPTYKLVEKLNLKDIDPTTISSGKPPSDGGLADIIGPYVIFSATTRDSAKVISGVATLYPAPVTEEPFTGDSLIFEMPYPYSDRFTKAFKHAVMLCGGKPSIF
jgi:hypothetical protein